MKPALPAAAVLALLVLSGCSLPAVVEPTPEPDPVETTGDEPAVGLTIPIADVVAHVEETFETSDGRGVEFFCPGEDGGVIPFVDGTVMVCDAQLDGGSTFRGGIRLIVEGSQWTYETLNGEDHTPAADSPRVDAERIEELAVQGLANRGFDVEVACIGDSFPIEVGVVIPCGTSGDAALGGADVEIVTYDGDGFQVIVTPIPAN